MAILFKSKCFTVAAVNKCFHRLKEALKKMHFRAVDSSGDHLFQKTPYKLTQKLIQTVD